MFHTVAHQALVEVLVLVGKVRELAGRAIDIDEAGAERWQEAT